jgi:hypothetical protein
MEEGKLIFRGVMTFGTKTDFINISKFSIKGDLYIMYVIVLLGYLMPNAQYFS